MLGGGLLLLDVDAVGVCSGCGGPPAATAQHSVCRAPDINHYAKRSLMPSVQLAFDSLEQSKQDNLEQEC